MSLFVARRLGLVAAVAIAVGACSPQSSVAAASAADQPAPVAAPSQVASSPQPVGTLNGRVLPDFATLVEQVGPAVVNVSVVEKAHVVARNQQPAQDGEDDPFQEFFKRFGIPNPGQQGGNGRRFETPQRQGEGSGFIVSADGYILTNAHVVDGAKTVDVKLTDRREFTAKVLGTDPKSDVALIKIDARDLPVVKIGNAKDVKPGQWVVAMGSPFGFENSVTAGIVSAKSRSLPGDGYVPFIQTDVAVNPGNSGGPLINMHGEVIGINSQILSGTGGSIGISFAIPVDDAMRVVEQLKNSGRVRRGRLGVEIREVGKDVAEAMGIKAQGALVTRVEAGTPAEKAGIVGGDIIVKFDGRPIDKSVDLPRAVGDTKPGTRSVLTILRKGQTKEIPIVVAELDADAKRADRAAPEAPKAVVANSLGLTVGDLPDERKRQLGIASGVVVENVDGPAATAGVRRDDIVLSLNNVDASSAKQFNEQAAKLDPKKQAFVLVRRQENVFYLPIRPTATP